MDEALNAAVGRLREAFAQYPRRAVLDGCPHCRGEVPIDVHNPFSLTISLSNTVGSRADVKSLVPVLLERMITSTELDPDIVLRALPREQWRTWPAAEQNAIDRYLDVVWRSLLAEYPSQTGSFRDAVTFLDSALATGESRDRFLATWEGTVGSAADRHLAGTVNGLNFAVGRPSPMLTWLRRESIRERLLRAFERDHDRPWADDLARAYDLIRR